MNDNIFRILAIIIFVIAASISIYHRKKADQAGGEKISLKDEGLPILLALRLGGLVFWVSVFAYLIHPAWLDWSRVDLPDWLRWMGVGMGIAGDFLAYWVFTSLGNNVTPTVVTRKNATLVTHGPYRWVRHPLYLMGLLAYLGFSLLAKNWFLAILTVLAFSLLNLRLPKEEAKLIERFGDEYRNYMQRTGKFLPRLNF